MFKVYASDQLGIARRISNHRAEVQPKELESLVNIFHDNQAQKAAAVKDLCGLMGLETAFSVGKQIERAVLEQSCHKVLDMKKELQRTFDLRLQEKAGSRGALKRGLELINQVFHKYGMTEVVTRRRTPTEHPKLHGCGGVRLQRFRGARGAATSEVEPYTSDRNSLSKIYMYKVLGQNYDQESNEMK